MVTCSVFAPNPSLVFDQLEQNNLSDILEVSSSTIEAEKPKFNSNASFKRDKSSTKDSKSNPGPGYVVISGDYDGEIKIFYNVLKPKHSSLPTWWMIFVIDFTENIYQLFPWYVKNTWMIWMP